jgi:hypothetical protein
MTSLRVGLGMIAGRRCCVVFHRSMKNRGFKAAQDLNEHVIEVSEKSTPNLPHFFVASIDFRYQGD